MGSKIAIVGAGITGPAAALSLARAGHHVTVYEQRPAGALFSAGILGITPGVWRTLTAMDAGMHVGMSAHELANHFRDYLSGREDRSPFRFITWTDLHNVITDAACDAGARFRFETRADASRLQADYVIDAGGITSAARRLHSVYSGFWIYRALSPLNVSPADGFTTYGGLPAGTFNIAYTREGATWQIFVRRPEPAHLRTVNTHEFPHEISLLPPEYLKIVQATPTMIVSPMSDWDVPATSRDASGRHLTMGDANGPVRPITTSGANLAVIAGLQADRLITGTPGQARAIERSLLRRRAYDQRLGMQLNAPEIGGVIDDADFTTHHSALFLAGER